VPADEVRILALLLPVMDTSYGLAWRPFPLY
jgi:hypothetical protein